MELILTAGETVREVFAGSSLVLLSATGPVEIWTRGVDPIKLEQGDSIPDLGAYTGKEWQIKNAHSVTQTIEFGANSLYVRRANNGSVRVINAPTIQGITDPIDIGSLPTINALMAPGSGYLPTVDPAVIAAGDSAEVIAANANRLSVTIGNPASNAQTKRIGVSGNVGADRGDKLEPGESVTLAITGALWVHNVDPGSGVAETVTVSEVLA